MFSRNRVDHIQWLIGHTPRWKRLFWVLGSQCGGGGVEYLISSLRLKGSSWLSPVDELALSVTTEVLLPNYVITRWSPHIHAPCTLSLRLADHRYSLLSPRWPAAGVVSVPHVRPPTVLSQPRSLYVPGHMRSPDPAKVWRARGYLYPQHMAPSAHGTGHNPVQIESFHRTQLKYLIFLHKTNTTVFTILLPSSEPNSISLAPLMLKLASMAISFIFLLVLSIS